MQKDYLQYWKQEYGYPDTMPDFIRIQRKRYLEQRWSDEARVKRLQELRQKYMLQKVARLPSLIRNYFFHCENKELMEQKKTIDPRYRITIKNKCYNVLDLYQNLSENRNWTKEQIKRIKRVYDRVCPGKPSSEVFMQDLEMREAEFKENLKNVENEKKENTLFGCMNKTDLECWRLLQSGRLVILQEKGKMMKYAYDVKDLVEQNQHNDYLLNPYTDTLIPKEKEEEIILLYSTLP